MGHLRVYTIADVISRFYKTTHPIGWDSFGLPAENAAKFNNKDPQEWTNHNISQMKNQLLKMNIDFDWTNELYTSDPKYYKWTQYIFLKLYEKGLIYQKESVVNWDPVDKTVLANEQVINGKGERSGALVEKKYLKQWYFKITQYAERLYKDLDELDWPEAVKQQQRNWIKPKTGRLIKFTVKGQTLECFSSESVTSGHFIAIGLSHQLVKDLRKNPEIKQYVDSVLLDRNSSKEIDGIFTGLYASNSEYSHNNKELISKGKLNNLPVDIYVGGIEHSIMHLLYARFISKFLTDIKLIDIPKGEPFKKLLTQGMVTGITFKCQNTHRYIPSNEIEYVDNQPRAKSTSSPVKVTFEKMSKSKFNGVNPHEVIQQYGTDVTRLFILYKAPPQDELAWDATAIVGMQRFLNRVQDLVETPFTVNLEQERLANTTVTKFNLAITELMKLCTSLHTSYSTEGMKRLLEMLSIFTPETASRLYEKIQPGKMLEFPKHTQTEKVNDSYRILVNGKRVKEMQIGEMEDELLKKVVLNDLGIEHYKNVIVNQSKRIVNVLK
ncbi:hypothetical protein HK103_006585 [Boothiomyces macroporosus]|uniref:leucine--tRNA ligase n=1 Tax=Boothiomyces macroporosus TaxID=261099 RepID=A0AAD5U9D0_9FUNG|nr:hypothetical protein HK103_002587 [Boothiomyces macroporosus]KAJ3255122.1 hypothetical protein HK103_006585 [Boothiomyces macroporosus]